MSRLDLLIGWELLSYSKQMRIQKFFKKIPNYKSRLSSDDLLKLESVKKRKKYTADTRDSKYIKRRNCLRMLKPNLTKLDSFIKQECSNSEEANEAWQESVENLSLIHI